MIDPIAIEISMRELHEKAKTLVRRNVRTIIELGETLKTIRDNEGYKKLGDGGYDTWTSYLQDPDLGISKSYALQSIQLFDFYVVELHMSLDEIAELKNIPLLRDCMITITKRNLSDNEAAEIIEKAKVLSYKDFAQEVIGKEFPIDGEVVNQELQTEEPQKLNGVISPSMTPEEKAEFESFQKPKVSRCDDCSKSRIYYNEDQICQCGGVFHLVNAKTEGGES